jgi:hypothetical protein
MSQPGLSIFCRIMPLPTLTNAVPPNGAKAGTPRVITRPPPHTIRWAITRKPRIMHRPRRMRQQRPNPMQNITVLIVLLVVF